MSLPSLTSLVLTRFRPDRPDGGAALRNLQNIRQLGDLGPVDVVSIGAEGEPAPVPGVRHWEAFPFVRLRRHQPRLEHWRNRLWRLRRGRHPAFDAYHSAAVLDWLRARTSETHYDVAVVEELSLARFLTPLRPRIRRLVFDAHNVEGPLRRDLAAQPGRTPGRERACQRLLNTRLRSEERRAVRNADLVWVCSDHDAQELQACYGPHPGVVVVPNGVEVGAYRTHPALDPAAPWPDAPLTLTYPGTFSYPPNEDAALGLIRDVLPALRARGQSARIVLAGRDPTPALLAAARADDAVVVTGAVPSILPFLGAATIVTLPIRLGSGTRLKIIESFAMRRPVVSTAKGAEGIAAQDGVHLLVREDPEAIAEAALELWRSPDLRRRLCEAADALVREHYSWEAAGRRIRQSLELGTTRGR